MRKVGQGPKQGDDFIIFKNASSMTLLNSLNAGDVDSLCNSFYSVLTEAGSDVNRGKIVVMQW